jgi:hypothetical protein
LDEGSPVMKRPGTPPKWQPRPGHMLFYRREVPISEVEKHARAVMTGFDSLSRQTRDRLNEGTSAKKRAKWKPTR